MLNTESMAELENKVQIQSTGTMTLPMKKQIIGSIASPFGQEAYARMENGNCPGVKAPYLTEQCDNSLTCKWNNFSVPGLCENYDGIREAMNMAQLSLPEFSLQGVNISTVQGNLQALDEPTPYMLYVNNAAREENDIPEHLSESEDEYLIVHFQEDQTLDQYVCGTCQMSFKSSELLKCHEEEHLKDCLYKCSKCSYKGTDKEDLGMHMSTCSSKKSVKQYRESADVSPKSHAAKRKTYKCQSCPYISRRLESLKIHLKTYHKVKLYTCDLCFIRFCRMSNLKAHLLKHLGQQRYGSEDCKSVFSNPEDLNQHKQNHLPSANASGDYTFSKNKLTKDDICKIKKIANKNVSKIMIQRKDSLKNKKLTNDNLCGNMKIPKNDICKKLSDTTLRKTRKISMDHLSDTTLNKTRKISMDCLSDTTLRKTRKISMDHLSDTTLRKTRKISMDRLSDTTLRKTRKISMDRLSDTTLHKTRKISMDCLSDATLHKTRKISMGHLSDTTLHKTRKISVDLLCKDKMLANDTLCPNKSTKSNLERSLQNKTGSNVQKTTRRANNVRSKASSQKQDLFRCCECEFIATNLDTYNTHIESHRHEEIKCKTCHFTCKNPKVLEEHELIHSGHASQAYKCAVCEYSCNVLRTMHRHMKKHPGMKNHIIKDDQKRKNKEVFRCEECSFVGDSPEKLEDHRSCHGEKKEDALNGKVSYRCVLCFHESDSVETLKKHLFTCNAGLSLI